MTTVLGAACLAEVVIAGLLLVRVAIGPTVCDRIVAVNAISTQMTLATYNSNFFSTGAPPVVTPPVSVTSPTGVRVVSTGNVEAIS